MNKQLQNIKYEHGKAISSLADLSRKAAAEGIVLLKNEGVLPFKNKKISVFGRIQTSYFKSGTGSGGLVNVSHVTNILEGLLQNPLVTINQELLDVYLNWIKENPYNAGNGMWASEPWSQIEMPLDDKIVSSANSASDAALIIIGRTAGEDRDNFAGEGSFCLSVAEENMMALVTKYFAKVVVVLNVGNVIDMSFLDKYHVSACLYAWHGGLEGGRAVSDVLTGLTNPSGKLADTIAYTLDDYPSTKNFGNKDKNFYQEDIYVGYRYFETFAHEKVRFPFGFGLSYTKFDISLIKAYNDGKKIYLDVKVKNTGSLDGKEVVQIYYSAPQGCLGKPIRQLAAFAKTPLLAPNQEFKMSFTISIDHMASYDDSGVTNHKSCYVLEKGSYGIFMGNSVRDNSLIYTYKLDELVVVEALEEACAPTESFKRLKPIVVKGDVQVSYEDVPTRTIDLKKRISDNEPKEIPISGKKIILKDVYDGKATMDEFVSQFSEYDLACLFRGEGMSSPKVTPGTAAAFGGVTKPLLEFGLPVSCASDGPSGIRMDSGQQATSLPNGTNMACTMNFELIRDLYYVEGKELLAYNIDTLLGPGMNIHRNPLNGRNFEYLSEDPLLTGVMGAAITIGLQTAGVTGTLKHMACNSQETARFDANSILSERALREIYLKGFEIAIKMGKSRAIMTSYNPVNGIWAAGNYDLNTTICHNEWGFKGLIMTDWWAKMNDDGMEPSKQNTKTMIISQNDLYMVISDSSSNSSGDNTMEAFESKALSKGVAQRSAKNICEFLLKTPAFKRNNNLEIKDDEYRVDYWFETNYLGCDYPVLSGIKVNGVEIPEFDPMKFVYFIDSKTTSSFDIEAINDKKYPMEIIKADNSNCTVISLKNTYQENCYYVIVEDLEKRRAKNRLIDISKIEPKFVNKIGDGNWESVLIDMSKPSFKTSKITYGNDGWEDCFKDEIVTFAVEFKAFGKYIVDMTLSSTESQLAQLPINILVDEDNKSTLTMSGTKGEWITVGSHIVIDEGLHYISFMFGRTGLKLSSVKLTKHS